MLPLVISFVIGLIVCCQLSQLPGILMLAGLLVLAIIAWIKSIRFVAFGLLGFIWGAGHGYLGLDQILPEALEGEDIVIQGWVDDIPVPFTQGLRFNFRVDQVIEPEGTSLPANIRLSWYSRNIRLEHGQYWQLAIRLKRPHSSLNPGGFDYERWLFLHQIRGTGYVRDQEPSNRLIKSADEQWGINRVRQSISNFFEQHREQLAFYAILKALTIGDKSDLTPSQWDVLRLTGTSHLVAISGLHIGIIAAFVFFITRWCWAMMRITRWSAVHVAAVVSIFASLAYALLAGFSIPTQRALIMVCVIMGGLLLKRNIRPLNIIALAMFIVTLYDPFAVLAPGFWLSFTAVALIGYVTHGRLDQPAYWAGLGRLQFVIAIGLLPVLLFFFREAPILGPVVNLIAIPLFSFVIVPLSLVAVALIGWFPDAAVFVFSLADFLLDYAWQGMEKASQLPLAEFSRGDIPLTAFFLSLLGVLLWFAPRGFPCRYLAFFFWLPLFFIPQKLPNKGSVWFTLLDVGQGLSAVVQTYKHVLVYDVGPRYGDRFDMGRNVVTPFLRSQGISSIDLLVLSHGDNDHSGGAASVLEAFDVSRLMTSQEYKSPVSDEVLCKAGMQWRWDDVMFEIMSPLKHSPRDENNLSCVLKITAVGGSILLTGDIEKENEEIMQLYYESDLLDSDILVLPHHGSNSSSTAKFLEAVDPEFALVSAGYRNRYNFPAKAVLKRLSDRSAIVLNTAMEGAIEFRIEHGKISRKMTFRESAGRFWNQRPPVLLRQED